MEGGWNGFILALKITLSFNFENFLRFFITVKFVFNFNAASCYVGIVTGDCW